MAKKKSSLSKTVSKETKKQVKKNPLVALFLLVLVAVGAAGGFFGIKLLTKNDTFEIIGEQTIELTIGQEYTEQGVKAISFGKDVSADVEIDSNVNINQAGEYYVKYTIDDFRFKDVVRYRYVKVVEASL